MGLDPGWLRLPGLFVWWLSAVCGRGRVGETGPGRESFSISRVRNLSPEKLFLSQPLQHLSSMIFAIEPAITPNRLYFDGYPEDFPMLKQIRIELPRYEMHVHAILSVAQYAGISVRKVLQSLRPRVRYR